MADRNRIVTIARGGKITVVRDLQDLATYFYVEKSFKVTTAPRKQQIAQGTRRYEGGRVVGESQENGKIEWRCLVKATTADQVNVAVDNLLTDIESATTRRFYEWRPDGATYSVFFEIVGPGEWQSDYEWAAYAGAQCMPVTFSLPVAPLTRGLPMRIEDDFSIDSEGDYTYDAGTAADTNITGGQLVGAGTLSTERRMVHSIRGYGYGDAQQTVKSAPGATITSYRVGVVLKRLDASNYIAVYVDDNGTNSRLRIDVVTAGVAVNKVSTNLAARIVNGTALWVRGRIEGNVVIAEHFTTAPTPMGAPTTTNTTTLAGADATAFGSAISGRTGITWIPQSAGAYVDDYTVEPFVIRNATLPAVLSPAGAIPGNAPALVEVTLTPSGGSVAPVWALLAWATRPAAGLATAPLAILEAESAGNLSGWASAADANARGGNALVDSAASSADTYSASWSIDPSLLAPDDFTLGDLSVEVWARVSLASTLVTPRLIASVRPEDGLSFGAERFTTEWGTAGKPMTVPSSSSRYAIVKLGTLQMYSDADRPRIWKLWLAATLGVGSSGTFSVDFLMLCPARARAAGPTSKTLDATYPKFVAGTGETSKTIRSDLSGLISAPPKFPHPDHGLGGSQLRMGPGAIDLLAVLHQHVPDDLAAPNGTAWNTHPATVQLDVTPRYFLTRGT